MLKLIGISVQGDEVTLCHIMSLICDCLLQVKIGICGWLAWAMRMKRPGHDLTVHGIKNANRQDMGELNLIFKFYLTLVFYIKVHGNPRFYLVKQKQVPETEFRRHAVPVKSQKSTKAKQLPKICAKQRF